MTGIYSAETLSYITGITSTVRFTTDNFPRIFVKVNPGVDPSNTVELYKFQLNRNTSSRELIRGKANAFGGASSTASASRLDLKKVGKELYEVLFINSMLAGEYAFLNLNWDAFCFTLEPGNIANGNGNTIPGIGSSIPPSTEQIKLDLIGYNIDGWMFQSSNTYSQFLQNSMKEEGGSLEYNISVVVIQPSSGKDRSKKMTIRVVYHKNKLGNWALYLAELG